jgi:hypothetical protein
MTLIKNVLLAAVTLSILGGWAVKLYEALSGPADAPTAFTAGFVTGQVLVYGAVLLTVVLVALIARSLWRRARR